jgi:hypothetical protein
MKTQFRASEYIINDEIKNLQLLCDLIAETTENEQIKDSTHKIINNRMHTPSEMLLALDNIDHALIEIVEKLSNLSTKSVKTILNHKEKFHADQIFDNKDKHFLSSLCDFIIKTNNSTINREAAQEMLINRQYNKDELLFDLKLFSGYMKQAKKSLKPIKTEIKDLAKEISKQDNDLTVKAKKPKK